MNPTAIFVTALIPLLVGAIWYNPKVLGTAWMKASGMTEEKMKGSNMLLIFGLTYLFGLFLAAILNSLVVHQNHIYSILANEPGFGNKDSEVGIFIADFMNKYGENFRTFKHGAFHGVLSGLLLALPIIGIIALFERRSFRYIAIHTGYWIITFTLMGGLISWWKG